VAPLTDDFFVSASAQSSAQNACMGGTMSHERRVWATIDAVPTPLDALATASHLASTVEKVKAARSELRIAAAEAAARESRWERHRRAGHACNRCQEAKELWATSENIKRAWEGALGLLLDQTAADIADLVGGCDGYDRSCISAAIHARIGLDVRGQPSPTGVTDI